MNARPEQSDPLWELLACACNGSLSPEQRQALENRLANDADARRLYLDYCELHSGMRFVVHSSVRVKQALYEISLQQADISATCNGAAECAECFRAVVSKRRSPRRTIWPGKLRFSLPGAISVLAGCLLGVLGTLAGVLLLKPDSIRVTREEPLRVADGSEAAGKRGVRSDNATLASAIPHETISATLTGVVDCRWGNGLAPPLYGEQIRPGRLLRLEAGLAQLTFESGAKVTLQGPASLTVLSSEEASMDVGKLTALVPVRARGFAVNTPSAEVVDLGTEFGLHVTDQGRTEVHVFQGEVVSWRVDKSGNTDKNAIQLIEQQAVSFDRELPTPQSIVVKPNKFVREISPRLSETDLPPLPVVRNLALWLAADVLVSTDVEKRIIAWQDILVGDNQLSEDAWQQDEECRPLFVRNGLGGKPTIRFDGDSDFLVTTPLASTDDQTLFIVFQREAESRVSHPKDPMLTARQLINYNGPPHGLTDSRILMLGDRLESGVYWGRVYAGWSDKSRRPIHLGSAKCQRKLEVREPAIITYSYHPSRNSAAIYLNGELQGEASVYGRAEMYLNGELQGEASVPPGQAIISRKVLGRAPLAEAYFEGDMSEVIIYNGALDESQIRSVVRYLGNKYSIDVAAAK